MATIAELLVKVGLDPKAIEAGADKAARAVEGFGSRANKVGGSLQSAGKKLTLFATLPLLGLGHAAVSAASDLNESINAIRVVFGPASKTIEAFGKTSAQTVGLSTRAFNELVTPVGAALQNVGFSADEAAEASINLAQRASDMASVFNVDVSDAMAAIQAGLRGEMDPLERFGVGLSESAVRAHALETGLISTDRELTQNEKAQARLSLIMAQTDKIAGDFARTSGEVANQERIAKAEAENAAAAFGQKLIPVKAKLIELATSLIDRFMSLSPQMQNIILITLGVVAVLGPLLAVVGSLITVIGGLAAALMFLAANPVILLILALVAVGVAAYVFRDQIIGAAQAVLGFLQRNWPLILAILTGPIGLAVLAIVKHWDKIKGFVTTAAGAVLDFLRRNWPLIVGILLGPIALIVAVVHRHWNTIRDTTVRIWNGIVAFFRGIPAKLWNAIVGAASSLFGLARHIMDSLWAGFKYAWGAVLGWLRGLPAQMWNAIVDAAGSLWRLGRHIIDSFWSGLKSAWSSAAGWLSSLPGKIASLKGPERDDKRLLIPHGIAIIEGLISGVERKLPGLFAMLGGIGGDINAGVMADIDARVAVPPPADPMRLIFDFAGADTEIGRALSKMVRVQGRGDVQVAFGG